MPFLHEHERRVPTQDDLCRIDVRVVSMSAGGADEARLVLATPAVHRAAREACARGVVGGHFDQRSAAFFQLAVQQGFKEMPALVQDRPVQTGLLANSAPRFLHRPTSGTGHVPGVQVFDHDRAEAPREIGAGPVEPIAADTGAAGRQHRHAPSGPGISPGPRFAARGRAAPCVACAPDPQDWPEPGYARPWTAKACWPRPGRCPRLARYSPGARVQSRG